MSGSTRSDFERERDRLVAEIAENLGKCVTAVNQLNRNIENVTQVGGGFDAVHHLWTSFQQVMANGSYAEAEQRPEPILGRSNDETIKLPAGLAPGGGESLYQSVGPEASAGDGK
ncbi:hypothetical protein NBRC10512_000907 [Rhodotorula toruloides]|uniref:DASH complex subunit DAD1 n=2 Tax=Rhodotorula toruloides TaxID=5286 RepID=A0A061B278_RHOTO|nr:DASH complex, subunit Dad1 [Rhodotorula toruloides NP11]EMS24256.1 DASH complex, subunit Dad1 [Rhodotorula toruloides NP11]KAJ8293431.1 DASH complex subunit dad1 [Rhodotorula toruloides]CDR41777.1 RHTO0S06e06106g1_1 [Rhodotorula toruloides]